MPTTLHSDGHQNLLLSRWVSASLPLQANLGILTLSLSFVFDDKTSKSIEKIQTQDSEEQT